MRAISVLSTKPRSNLPPAAGGRLTWLGDLLFALAGCSWGVFTFLLRRWRVAPLRAVAAVTIPSALAIVPAWLLITGGVLPPVPAGTILAQWFFQGAMGGVLGVAAFGGAVRALGAAKASALPSFTPAVTTLLGILALGHLPTRLELLGMALATLACCWRSSARGRAGLASRRKLTPEAQRIDQQREGRRGLAAARVVEVVAQKGGHQSASTRTSRPRRVGRT